MIVCRSCFYQLRQLRVVRRSLTFEASVQLVHAFINSRLDYCNSLLAGVGDQLISQLQSVLRAAARLVLQKKKFDRISDDIRNKLHWLPIRQRISFKLCLLVFRCLRGEAPPYLSEMLSLVSNSDALRSHRSAARGDLIIPRTFTKTFGPRGFAVSGPTAWNALPPSLKNKDLSPTVFRSKLKTHLFNS